MTQTGSPKCRDDASNDPTNEHTDAPNVSSNESTSDANDPSIEPTEPPNESAMGTNEPPKCTTKCNPNDNDDAASVLTGVPDGPLDNVPFRSGTGAKRSTLHAAQGNPHATVISVDMHSNLSLSDKHARAYEGARKYACLPGAEPLLSLAEAQEDAHLRLVLPADRTCPLFVELRAELHLRGRMRRALKDHQIESLVAEFCRKSGRSAVRQLAAALKWNLQGLGIDPRQLLATCASRRWNHDGTQLHLAVRHIIDGMTFPGSPHQAGLAVGLTDLFFDKQSTLECLCHGTDGKKDSTVKVTWRALPAAYAMKYDHLFLYQTPGNTADVYDGDQMWTPMAPVSHYGPDDGPWAGYVPDAKVFIMNPETLSDAPGSWAAPSCIWKHPLWQLQSHGGGESPSGGTEQGPDETHEGPAGNNEPQQRRHPPLRQVIAACIPAPRFTMESAPLIDIRCAKSLLAALPKHAYSPPLILAILRAARNCDLPLATINVFHERLSQHGRPSYLETPRDLCRAYLALQPIPSTEGRRLDASSLLSVFLAFCPPGFLQSDRYKDFEARLWRMRVQRCVQITMGPAELAALNVTHDPDTDCVCTRYLSDLDLTDRLMGSVPSSAQASGHDGPVGRSGSLADKHYKTLFLRSTMGTGKTSWTQRIDRGRALLKSLSEKHPDNEGYLVQTTPRKRTFVWVAFVTLYLLTGRVPRIYDPDLEREIHRHVRDVYPEIQIPDDFVPGAGTWTHVDIILQMESFHKLTPVLREYPKMFLMVVMDEPEAVFPQTLSSTNRVPHRNLAALKMLCDRVHFVLSLDGTMTDRTIKCTQALTDNAPALLVVNTHRGMLHDRPKTLVELFPGQPAAEQAQAMVHFTSALARDQAANVPGSKVYFYSGSQRVLQAVHEAVSNGSAEGTGSGTTRMPQEVADALMEDADDALESERECKVTDSEDPNKDITRDTIESVGTDCPVCPTDDDKYIRIDGRSRIPMRDMMDVNRWWGDPRVRFVGVSPTMGPGVSYDAPGRPFSHVCFFATANSCSPAHIAQGVHRVRESTCEYVFACIQGNHTAAVARNDTFYEFSIDALKAHIKDITPHLPDYMHTVWAENKYYQNVAQYRYRELCLATLVDGVGYQYTQAVPQEFRQYLPSVSTDRTEMTADATDPSESARTVRTDNVPAYESILAVESDAEFRELLAKVTKEQCPEAALRCARYRFDAIFANSKAAFAGVKDVDRIHNAYVTTRLTVQNRSKVRLYLEAHPPKMDAFKAKLAELWPKWYQDQGTFGMDILPQLRMSLRFGTEGGADGLMLQYGTGNALLNRLPMKILEIRKIAEMLGLDHFVHLEQHVPRDKFLEAAKYMVANARSLSNLFGFKCRPWVNKEAARGASEEPNVPAPHADPTHQCTENEPVTCTQPEDSQSTKRKKGRPKKQVAVRESMSEDENLVRHGMSLLNDILKSWAWGLFIVCTSDNSKRYTVVENGRTISAKETDFKLRSSDKYLEEHTAQSLLKYISD